MRSAILWTTVSTASLALASAAFAQSAEPLGVPADGASGVVEEVVVTGSRIARRDFVSPSPIVTATETVLQQQGISNVEQSLNTLPQFTAAGNATNGGRGGGQRATLNLRGLGANRNLVLLDGRRLPFASADGQTDVNIIPSSLLQGVETITGGASAIYGSDAMSGVVNFQTRRNFTGMQVDAQYGNTFLGDRQTREITITGGGTFSEERGSAILSVGYSDRERLHGDERDFTWNGTLSGFLGTGAYVPTTTNLPNQQVLNSIFQRYDGRTTNVPRTGGTANIGFNDDGTLFLYNDPSLRNYRGRTSGDYIVVDGLIRHPFEPTLDITSAQERRWLFGKLSYEIVPNIDFYTQVLHTYTWTDQDDGTSLTQFGTLNTIPVTNPFIPADLRTLLASRPNPTEPMQYNGRYIGVPHKGWTDTYDVTQFIAGFRGDVGIRDWTFDAYLSTDTTNSKSVQRNGVIKAKVQELWNAPDGGRSLCAGGFNPFGDANNAALSTECIDYVTATLTNLQEIKQDIVEATVQGSLFALPAGDVRFSVVADRRKQEYKYTPDSRLKNAGDIEAANAQTPTQGVLTVNEIAGELLVPVLANLPLIKSLNIGAAYRYSDYNYAGGNSTYKIDGDWTITPGLLVRGGYARAVRAPNMAESFFQGQVGTVGLGGNPPAGGEPCDVRTNARMQGGARLRQLCIDTGVPAAVVDSLINPTQTGGSTLTNGNPNLDPESADTFTAGVVIRPEWGPRILQNLSLSVDFYDIKISKVIGTVNSTQVLNSCYNVNGFNPNYDPRNIYCTLITRDSNGNTLFIDTPYLNLGGLHVRGIDFQIDYRQPIGPGTLTFNSIIGHKLKDATKDFEDSPWVELVGTGNRYRWQATSSLGYTLGPAQAGVRFRYAGGQKDATWVTRPTSPAPGRRPFYAFDINASYQITDDLSVRAGINNLWQPSAPVRNNIVATTSNLYDSVGRQYYMALRSRF
jgi:outer membrane receptor protein involved in Fe transport